MMERTYPGRIFLAGREAGFEDAVHPVAVAAEVARRLRERFVLEDLEGIEPAAVRARIARAGVLALGVVERA